MYLSILGDFWIHPLKIPTLVLFYSPAQTQMVVLLQILVYWLVLVFMVVWILLKEVLFPSSPCVAHWGMDLLVSIVNIVVVIVSTIANYVDFHCCPSNFHICFFSFVVRPQALETWHHFPSWSFAFALSSISLVKITFVMHQHSNSLHVPMLAVQMVPLPFIILWPLPSMLSYFFFTLNPKVPPSSTLAFLFRALLGNFGTTFLMFSNATCISSLVFLTLVCGFYGLSYLWKQQIFKNLCQNQG